MKAYVPALDQPHQVDKTRLHNLESEETVTGVPSQWTIVSEMVFSTLDSPTTMVISSLLPPRPQEGMKK